jgi:SAM-dependent methyltransferase
MSTRADISNAKKPLGVIAISQSNAKVVKTKEYNNSVVRKTFDANYQPEFIKDAILKEYAFLDQLDWSEKVILDVGCGEGRHGIRYAARSARYIGVDLCEEMIKASQKNWGKIANTSLIQANAAQYQFSKNSVDRAMSLWFTPGNFRRDDFDVANYSMEEINQNPQFIKIVSNMYQALKPNGHILLTVYKDKKKTREMQKSWYARTGQTVLTKDSDPFVATKEGFWSLRWTKERMFSNLRGCGIRDSQVVFHDLSPISWIVEIKK